MNIAAIIVGIDGWEQYTGPLVWSIGQHEPNCEIVIIDNASEVAYPTWAYPSHRTNRLCYSAAINEGKRRAGDADWYIVLSNDVICEGPFAHILEAHGDSDLVGPCLKQELGFDYLEGWAVCIPTRAWEPWDERFLGSDYEDVAYSTSARRRGFGLVGDPALPFKHLDQRQRFHVVDDFWGKNAHNRELFMREYGQAVTA
jgi:hypothetical protein